MLRREESCAQREIENGELQSVVWYEELQIGNPGGSEGIGIGCCRREETGMASTYVCIK
jgi:hypothetical protein